MKTRLRVAAALLAKAFGVVGRGTLPIASMSLNGTVGRARKPHHSPRNRHASPRLIGNMQPSEALGITAQVAVTLAGSDELSGGIRLQRLADVAAEEAVGTGDQDTAVRK